MEDGDMVAPHPNLAAQEARQGLRAFSCDVEPPPELERRSGARAAAPDEREHHRSALYERLVLIQSSEVLRAEAPSVYRLALTVAMLAAPDLFASVSTLAAHTGLSESATKKAIRALHRIGFLRDKGAGWKKHAKGWTRLREVCWAALHAESDTGGVQPDTPEGVHVDTPRGAHPDTHKQQERVQERESKQPAAAATSEHLPAKPNPRGRHASPEGLEGGGPLSGSDAASRLTTTASTPPGVAAVELAEDLGNRERLRALGLSKRDAAVYASAFSANAIDAVCSEVESKGDASNPPGLVVHLFKTDHPDEWDALQGQRALLARVRATASNGRPLGRAGRAPEWHSGRRGHPSSCTCEECFERTTKGLV